MAIVHFFSFPQTDCPGTDPVVECKCRNEFWINPDCTQGFLCSEKMDDSGVSEGQVLTCPEDRPIIVPDLTFGGRADCTEDLHQCPGSYHFGCVGGDIFQSTTETPEVPDGTITPDPEWTTTPKVTTQEATTPTPATTGSSTESTLTPSETPGEQTTENSQNPPPDAATGLQPAGLALVAAVALVKDLLV